MLSFALMFVVIFKLLDYLNGTSNTSDLSNSVPINTTASYTSDLSNSVSVNTKASYTSDLSNSVLANTKGDDQESQDNVVTGQSALLGGQVNHAMRLSLPRSECDPNENRKVAKSKLRTPDVVSDTNQYAESAALHVPVGKNGSQKKVRPTLLRPTQPASPAKEHLYGNVKRKIQPQQKSGSGGVPKPIGVDGTVYAKLSFQPAKHDHRVRRTEEPSPYSTVDFSRKAPPLEEEEEVLVQYIT
ncbi:uncharacterized protein LOC135502573 [Lineus longissimus]|uniref:uncharacterized protein LOC135502573 n=1 Tax=Lineus longissimus TaxID=88925 RepID=UPI00315DFEF9